MNFTVNTYPYQKGKAGAHFIFFKICIQCRTIFYKNLAMFNRIWTLLWQAKQAVSALCQLHPATQAGQILLALAKFCYSMVLDWVFYIIYSFHGISWEPRFVPNFCYSFAQHKHGNKPIFLPASLMAWPFCGRKIQIHQSIKQRARSKCEHTYLSCSTIFFVPIPTFPPSS